VRHRRAGLGDGGEDDAALIGAWPALRYDKTTDYLHDNETA
jgi:hypothetical protein